MTVICSVIAADGYHDQNERSTLMNPEMFVWSIFEGKNKPVRQMFGIDGWLERKWSDDRERFFDARMP